MGAIDQQAHTLNSLGALTTNLTGTELYRKGLVELLSTQPDLSSIYLVSHHQSTASHRRVAQRSRSTGAARCLDLGEASLIRLARGRAISQSPMPRWGTNDGSLCYTVASHTS